MIGCTCEPNVQLPFPHAPWDCRFNPEIGWEERWCDWCGFNSISEECPEHGWLIAAVEADEGVAA